MNGMLKNLKRNCDIMHVAPFTTISISIFSFIAGLLVQQFFYSYVIASVAKQSKFLINN